MERIFSIRLSDPVRFVTYSAGGNFIIAARKGIAGFIFIDSRTGRALQSPEALSASIAFAATGRSERSMISYFSSGVISYWDLTAGKQTNTFNAPPNLEFPSIFGNSRFFAGIDSDGMAVVDAISGELVERVNSIPGDSILAADSDELYCLVRQGPSPGIHYFSMDRNGKINEKAVYPAPVDCGTISAFSVNQGNFALGTTDGNVFFLDKNGIARQMSYHEQTQVSAAAVSSSDIAFVTSDSGIGFLPSDYDRIADTDSFPAIQYGSYTRISPVNSDSGSSNQFLAWQSADTETYPCIISADMNAPPSKLNGTTFRFPLRKAEAFANKLLRLDTMGNVSVWPFSGDQIKPYSFFSLGSMDAAFINKDNVLVCRSAVSGNTPFVMINTVTGETVPLAWPCIAGVMAYRGDSGTMYAVILENESDGAPSTDTQSDASRDLLQESDDLKTSVIRLNTSYPAYSQKIMEFAGDLAWFSMAESGSQLAMASGEEGLFLYDKDGSRLLERTPGMPVQVCAAAGFFILLDTEGNIAWYDTHSGSLDAVLALYPDGWVLRTHDTILRGNSQN